MLQMTTRNLNVIMGFTWALHERSDWYDAQESQQMFPFPPPPTPPTPHPTPTSNTHTQLSLTSHIAQHIPLHLHSVRCQNIKNGHHGQKYKRLYCKRMCALEVNFRCMLLSH